MFSRLFVPKWKHPKASVRRAALEALPDEAQAIFRQVAEGDADAVIRRLALRRLRDPEVLWELCQGAAQDSDRTIAAQHLTQLLCGLLADGPSLAQRLQFLQRLDGEHWFERLLKEGRETELRLQALARVSRQSLLGDAALQDPDAGLRLAAAQRLSQRSTLERVAKGARRQDKRVHQCVRQALAALDAADSRPRETRAQAEHLHTQLQALLKAARRDGDWGRIETAVGNLRRQWAALDVELLEADTREAFLQGLDRFDHALREWREGEERLARERAARAEKLAQGAAICGELEALCKGLCAEGRVRDRPAVERARDVCLRSWRELSLPSDAEGATLDERFARAQADLAQVLADEALLAELQPRLEALQQSVQERLVEGVPSEPVLRELERQWQELPRPVQLQMDADREGAVRQGLAALRSSLQRERQRQEEARDELAEMVARLERHLRERTYKPAFVLAQKAQQLLDTLDAEAQKPLQKSALLKRLRKVQAELREMRDWRNFANAPVMEQLCEDMERLADAAESAAGDDFDYGACAARVRRARAEWKKMTEAQGGAPKALWRRFDAACGRAYAPCEVFFEGQRAQREANLRVRESVCEGLENYAIKVGVQPAEEVDWAALEKIIRTADREWRGLGPVPRQKQKAINRRFRKVMDTLRALARRQRERNHERKAELVRQAETLRQRLGEEREELSSALEKAKALQAEWKQIGQASRDGELWRRFHAACDAVFAQRRRQRDASERALHEQVEMRARICAQIEAAAEQQGEAFRRARQAVDEAHARWQAAERLPKREMERLERRYRAACAAFEKRLQAERQAQREQEWQRLYAMAALCQSLEWLADGLAAGETAAAQVSRSRAELSQRFEALGELHGAAGKGVAERWRRAQAWLDRLLDEEADRQTLQEKLAEERDQALQARLELCLQLEIAAAVESPAEFREARLAYQVSHLAEQMKQGGRPPLGERLDALERAWLSLPAAPAGEAEALAGRFEGVLNAARILSLEDV